MKAIAMLVLIFVMGKGCNEEAKNDLKDSVLEYTANTRGFYTKIVINNQTVSVSRDRNSKLPGETTPISQADWNELVSAFQDVTLEEIPNLKAPSEKRFYDGAAIANLTVTYKGQTYASQAFDHLTPPAEIEKLVNKIVSFSKEEE